MASSIDVIGSRTAHFDLAQTNKETVLFWAIKGAMFQGLTQAMQSRLTNIDIVLVDQMPAAAPTEGQVRLVLLQLNRNDHVLDDIAACRQAFPDVIIALVFDDTSSDLTRYEELLEREIVQGLLPLELKLEVFVAAISLLIMGGEYAPPALARRLREPPPAAPVPVTVLQAPVGAHNTQIARLTSRERQILALVSEGFQNKLIADRMALSEHTVKVHVHNLISKLRVSNRTQAAAAFRSIAYAPDSNHNQAAFIAPGWHER